MSVTIKTQKVTYWRDKQVRDLTREELIEAIEYLGEENAKLRQRAAESLAKMFERRS